jgi:DNA-binding NarL/FixJ family response regulator
VTDLPRVLIAGHAPTRVGIAMALASAVEICAQAPDAGQAIRAAMREEPDVCLLDRDLRGDVFTAVRGISRGAPRAEIILLTNRFNADEMLDAVRVGASGYISAAVTGEQLRRIVRAAANHEAAVPRALVRELILEIRSTSGNEGLTSREAQILGMLRRGHTTSQIADRLKITPVTVRRHISQLVRKVGVENRSALIGLPRG